MTKKPSRQEHKLNDLIPDLGSRGMDLSLNRIKDVLVELGKPCQSIPAIQIAGTNGKGSIASFLQSALKISGIKVGITTSPHLISWCERICINNKKITTNELINLIQEIRPISKAYQLTPFELIITCAFKYFDLNNVNIIILETGLGGRLDATTAHPYRPLIAMGGIGFDHCEYLGNSLEEITKEKAAIITQGSIVISAEQKSEVRNILEVVAREKNARLKWVEPLDKNWSLGIGGDIQRKNAAVAKSTLEELFRLGFTIKDEEIKTGFELAYWPGRLQKVFWNGLPILLDGAHNPHAAEELAKERQTWKNQNHGIYWILAIQANKDAPSMIKCLVEPNDYVWLLKVPNHKSWSKESIVKYLPELSNKIFSCNNLGSTLEDLFQRKAWEKSTPVIAGSLYLIGSILQSKKLEVRGKF